MFSADPVPAALLGTLVAMDTQPPASEVLPAPTAPIGATVAPIQTESAGTPSIQPSLELVFVDRRVDDAQALIDQLLGQADSGRRFAVIELDQAQDGVAQITRALGQFHDVGAIHLLSHGEEGQLLLGSTVLDLASLNAHAGEIVTWGAHLAKDADILLYGCDLAATDAGRTLAEQLSLLTGADVAASTNATGDQGQGGDWTLEYAHGQVETPVALNAQGQASWAHVLGLTPVAVPATEVIVDGTGTSATNTNRSVGVAADGRSVVIWMEGGAIYANRYDSAGAQSGGTITVSSGTEPIFAGIGGAAQVSMNDNGEFAVTYSFMNMGVQAPMGDAIRVQRYNADGTTNGGVITVAVKVYNAVFLFSEPTIALDNSGHFVVGYYTGVAAVAGAFYNSSGTLVQSVAPGAGSDVNAAISENGRAILTWTNAATIRGQLYDVATGSAIGGAFDISAGGTNQSSSVAMDDNGNIAVAWVSNVNGTNDIFVRRYDASGAALGGVRQANTYTTSDQTAPSVGMDTDGDFIVAWQSNGQDGAGMGVYARQFYSSGGAGLGEQRVNTTTAGNQVAPSAAMVGGRGVVVWSGNAASDILSRRFDVTDNTAPTLSTTVGGIGYTENAAATALDTGLVLGDSDSAEMEGAIIQITGNYLNGQDILAFVNQNGISGAWDASTGTLTLTGVASLASYQTALRSVGYRNSSEDPGTAARTVSFRVSDGGLWSLSGTRTVSVTSVNDAPTVSTSGGSAAFLENAGAVAVDPGLVVGDLDNATLAGATVRITANYVNGQDSLVFANQNGITGSWNTASGTLTLSGNATVAQYQAALRSITYSNASDTPSTLARTISVQLSDGALASNIGTRTVTVSSVNDAPTLVSTGSALNYTENAGAVVLDAGITVSDADTANLTGATIIISANHANGQDLLSFTNQNGITGAWNAGTGTLTLSGSATVAQYQAALRSITYSNGSDNPSTAARTVTITATDGSATSPGATRTITVAATNDAPTATIAPPSYTVNEQTTLVLQGTGLSIADVDADAGVVRATLSVLGGTLSATAGGSGATLSGSGTGTLVLTGTVAQINALLAGTGGATLSYLNSADAPPPTDTLSLLLSDQGNTGTGGALTASDSATIDITAINDGPSIAANQPASVNRGAVLNITATALRAADPDHTAAQLIFTLTALPGGGVLSLNGVALGLNGTFTQADINAGRLSYTQSGGPGAADGFTFQVSDGAGGVTGSANFSISVVDVNLPPVVDTNSPVTVAEGASVLIDNGHLSSSDADNSAAQLRYSLTNIPASGQLLLNGMALNLGEAFTQDDIDNGRLSYQHGGGETLGDSFGFVLDDGAGGSVASALFSITVTPVNDAPLLLNNHGASLVEQGSVVLTPGMLQAGDSDNPTASLGYVLQGQPAHGQLTLNGTLLAVGGSFTQNDIDSGRLRYQHDGGETVTDAFVFDVRDGVGGNTASLSFALTITPVNDLPALGGGASLGVVEDGQATITAGQLNSSDNDHTAAELGYQLGSAPAHGQLRLNGAGLNAGDTFTQDDIDSGRLVYHHDGSDSLADAVSLVLTDAAGGAGGSITLLITITAVDDAPQLSANLGATVDERGTVTLSPGELSANDPDTSSAQVRYTLTSVATHGQLLLNGIALGLGGSFTQADINQGRVQYRHDGSETSADQWSFSFGDAGTGVAGADTFLVTVNAVNDAPVITLPPGFQFTPGQALSLQGGHWSITDSDAGALPITATLQVQSGILVLSLGSNNNVLATGSGSSSLVLTGSASELTALLNGQHQGQLSYLGGSGPFTSDVLVINVSDAGTQGSGTAQSVQRQSSISGPAVSSPTGPVLLPPRLEQDQQHPAGHADEQPPGNDLPVLVAAPEVAPDIPLLQGGDEAPGAGTGNPGRGSVLHGMTLRFFGGTSASFPDQSWPYNSLLPGVSVSHVLGGLATDVALTLHPGEIHIDGQLHWQHRSMDVIAPSFAWVSSEKIQLAALMLSLGSVWWLSRTSGLLGSLLFTVPLWRQIDPLPVLTGQAGESPGNSEDTAHPSDRAVRAENMFSSAPLPDDSSLEIA